MPDVPHWHDTLYLLADLPLGRITPERDGWRPETLEQGAWRRRTWCYDREAAVRCVEARVESVRRAT